MNLQFIGIVIALSFSAWFAGSETTFLSYNKARFQAWFHRGKRGTRAVDFLSRSPERFLIITLIGNNLSNVLYSSLIALWLVGLGFSEELILVTAPIILLVFGEHIPKAIARQSADRIVPTVGVILYWQRALLWPIARLVEIVLIRMQRRMQIPEQAMGQALSRIEIASVLRIAGQEGLFPKNTREILRRFFLLSERWVKDIMTPRTAVVALDLNTPPSEARRRIIDSGFTRLPCYRDDIDNIVGVLVAQDLLKKPPDIQSITRPLPSVPASLTVVELVSWMKRHRTSLAGVLDEYGGLAGIVTVDDIARELVGLIKDEYDADDHQCIRLSKKVWLVDGRARMSLLTQQLGFKPFKEKAISLGGAIIKRFGSIPKVGDELDLPAMKIRVVRANPRGVGLVRITIKDPVDSERRS